MILDEEEMRSMALGELTEAEAFAVGMTVVEEVDLPESDDIVVTKGARLELIRRRAEARR